MDLNKVVTIAVTLCILAVALLVRRFVRTWTHPAVIFGLFWFVMSFVPLVVMWTVGRMNYYGAAFILALVVAFALPSFFMDWKTPALKSSEREGGAVDPPGYWHLVFYAMIVAALGCIVMNLSVQGISPFKIVSHPMQSAFDYMWLRYDGKVIPNLYISAGNVLNYIIACVGGLLIVEQKTKSRVASVLALNLTPALLYMLIYSDKGALFLAVTYFYGALLVSRISRGNLALVTKSDAKVVALALLVLIPALIFAMLSRGAFRTDNAERLQSLLFYLDSYAFGHFYAFSDWFDYYLNDTRRYYGVYHTPVGFWTFMAIGKHLRPDIAIPAGYFAELYGYKTLMQTNIYTMFRGMVYDFGVAGSVAFMGGLGWISALAYRRMLRVRHAPVSQSFYIFLIAFIYSSFMLSLLTWTSAYVVAGAVTVILFARAHQRRETQD